MNKLAKISLTCVLAMVTGSNGVYSVPTEKPADPVDNPDNGHQRPHLAAIALTGSHGVMAFLPDSNRDVSRRARGNVIFKVTEQQNHSVSLRPVYYDVQETIRNNQQVSRVHPILASMATDLTFTTNNVNILNNTLHNVAGAQIFNGNPHDYTNVVPEDTYVLAGDLPDEDKETFRGKIIEYNDIHEGDIQM